MNAPLSTQANNEMSTLTLDNGLRLITQPSTGAPVVAFQIWIHAGCFDELEGERGLAHLHEHMLFKGTPTRGVGEIAAAVEAEGGYINAWTSHDQTCYYVVMPAHAWKTGLDVLSDAVCNSLFDGEELGREIEVVVEEIKRSEDSPGRLAWRTMSEMIFAGHPYALPVLGTIDSVRSMTSERMLAFWGKHYVAANTTVIAAGDLDPTEVAAEVQARFGGYSLAPAQTKPAAVPPRPKAAARVRETSFSESRVMLSFPAPDLSHVDVPALDLFALILGQGESCRLNRRVRRDRQLVNDVGASCYTPRYAGLFSLSATTDVARLEEALDACMAELRELLDKGFSTEELERARSLVLAEATYKRETVQGLANSIGYFAVAGGDPSGEQAYFAAVAEVSAEQVLDAARRWLRSEHAQVAILPGKELADSGVMLPSEAQWCAKVQQALATVLRTAPAPNKDIVDGIERIDLPSGDVLLVRNDGSNVPVVSLRVATLAGLRAESVETSGQGRLMSELLTRGTTLRSADQISLATEAMASDISGFSGRNSMGMTLHCMTRNLEPSLDLLFDSLRDAQVPEMELEVARKAQLQDIAHASDAPARIAFRAALEALYGDHPYALDTLGTKQSVCALSRNDLLSTLRGRMASGRDQRGRPRLVWSAAGDVNADNLAERIAEACPARDTELLVPTAAQAPYPQQKVEVRRQADKAQAHVVLAFPGTHLDHPDRFAMGVLTTVLSGQGGRLFLQLRDKQSLAYTVSAMSSEGIDAGHLAFYIGTSPDKVQEALTGLYHQIDLLVQHPISKQELARATQQLAGSHAIGLQRSGARAATLCFNELYGLPRDAWSDWLDQMLSVSLEDVQRVAQSYLTVGRHVEAILAP
ncbi:MAG TPA: insulinase family protein [Myxococcales bacterium]|nr:peptidase M16 [Myxococcales bacterium]HAN31764.1 insulinase family protein [Myxococcales bacterium]